MTGRSVALLAWLAGASSASAATVELPEGAVMASFRVRGMGGTCAALAESSTCQLVQPATVGIRRPYDDNAWGADTTIQAPKHPVLTRLFGGQDDPAPSLRTKWQVGGNLKMNRFAAGLHLRQDGFAGPDGNYTASQWAVPGGVTGGTWALGATPVLLTWQTPEGAVSAGLGAGLGALWAPDTSPLRVGWALRSPVRTQSLSGRAWDSTRLPARGTFGLGWGFGIANGSRTEWPDRIRPTPDAPYVQVFSEVEVTGRSGEAVGVFAGGEAPMTVVVRGGGEVDTLKQHLRLRAGAYNEPQRFGDDPDVLHLTTGAAVHVFTWLQGLRWRVGASLDWAPGAPSVGFGLETW